MTAAPHRPVLRYHGGKWRLAPWIIGFFPEHKVYVESFGGGASVLMRKPPVYAEIYNDLDEEIVNLFRVARDRGEELVRVVELTPYSRADFEESFTPTDDPLERARRTAIRSFMGFGGNLTRPNRDQSPQRTGFRNYSSTNRRSIPAGDWRNWPEGLVQIIARLRGVIIEQRDAKVVIAAHDAEHTLHYVDPPYVHSTRGFDAGNTHRGYRHEMDEDQHRDLAVTLRAVEGMVVLSGYACELYDVELYPDWNRFEKGHMADGARARTEVVWLNPACVNALRRENYQHPLFTSEAVG
jgi:DNA adenine methylase